MVRRVPAGWASFAALAVLLLALAPPAGAGAQSMWSVFGTPGWSMRSEANGHITTFHIHRLSHWACWRGELVDLQDVKQAPEDYWGPGSDVIGNQIELHDPDGSWRMVGTYTQSAAPGEEWTMQVHGYPGRPTPYVIVPGRQVNSDTRTEYFLDYSQGIVSSCLHTTPPGWGVHVYWRSLFRFTAGGLRAHYEENMECGALACQIENWTFTRGRGGITSIEDVRSSGRALGLLLRRTARREVTRPRA